MVVLVAFIIPVESLLFFNYSIFVNRNASLKGENMEEQFTTTFWQDFSIADVFGIDAVKDTYKRAFEEWKSDYRYLTDLVMVVNHKCWQHYEKGNNELSQLYSDLYYKADAYACENLKDEELSYYLRVTD